MKRIIICCDGTWNKPGNHDKGVPVQTNVERMYDAILPKDEAAVTQVRFYGQGVGTGFSISNRLMGGITGEGIDRNIKDAYKFLMWNYQPGDHLFFFGFSRGAYTARSLVGWLRNCGILQPQYLHLVDEAFGLYRNRTALTHPDSDLMISFRRQYASEADTPVQFIGVWDTVGALGIPLPWFRWLNKQHAFHDVTLSSNVRYACQALAIDEKRKLFTPTLWEQSESVRNGEKEQLLQQVWFPGAHSNVGGGYADTGLSDQAFLWMKQEAYAAGLRLNEQYLEKHLRNNSAGLLRRSDREGFYLLLPRTNRLIHAPAMRKVTDEHSGAEQLLPVVRNEAVHYTCFEREHQVPEYRPRNVREALTRKDPAPCYPAVDEWLEQWQVFNPFLKQA